MPHLPPVTSRRCAASTGFQVFESEVPRDDRGVVHQYVDVAERAVDLGEQSGDLLRVRTVRAHG
jgi:hypothetical protein